MNRRESRSPVGSPRRIVGRAPARALLVALAATVAACVAPVAAQDDPDVPTAPPSIIELTAVKGVPKGKGWEIEYSGKAQKLPEGAIVEFELLLRTYVLGRFEIRIDASRQFRGRQAFEELTGFAPEVYLRAKIDFFRQPREVQEALEKDPETFDLSRSPWQEKFWDLRFPLGTEKEFLDQEKTVRGFFLDALKRALAAEGAFNAARASAEDGSRFRKGENFDPESWQTHIEEKVRDPLRALQAEMRAEDAGLRLMGHKRDLGYLQEIVNAVALRSYERSRSLYQKLGLDLDPKDLSPREIEIHCKSTSGSQLEKTTERLCRSQGIEMAELAG